MMNEKVQIIHLQMVKDADIAYGKRKMGDPKEAAGLIKSFLGEADRECVVVCASNTKMEPTYIQLVGIGAVNYCHVSIPEIFKAALLSNAANIFLFHNHPSGDSTPSDEDLILTERVLEAGRLVGIRLMDHIILGADNEFYSLREACGYMGWEDMEWKGAS